MTDETQNPADLVSDDELRDCLNPDVGDGNPETAVDQDPRASNWKATTETEGISPKAVAAALSALAVYVGAEHGLELPGEVVAALETLLVFGLTWLARPGRVRRVEVIDG